MTAFCCFIQRKPGLLVCRICAQPWRTQSPPERAHRKCRGVLDWRGRLLARLEPGDGIAFAAKCTGMAFLAELWEEITQQDCGCADRQAWLNQQWQRIVWKYFAYLPADTAVQ